MAQRIKELHAPVDRRASGRRRRPLDRSDGMLAGCTWFMPMTDRMAQPATCASNFSERRMQYGRTKC